MIVGEIRRYLRDSCALKVGRGTKDLAYKALAAREELSRRGCAEPDDAAVAEYLGVSASQVAEALDAISDPVSLFDTVRSGDGDETTLADRIAGQNGESWIDGIALRDALRHCTPKEARILRIRYFRGLTQTEAAEETGVSQAQISRIEKAALQKLRKYMT